MAMQEEMFEIIDASGKVVGTEKRSIVHAKGLLHKGVHGFVLDKTDNVFIQRRSLEKENEPGKWDASVAEHLKPGESFECAFVRGVMEELGAKAVNVERIGKRRAQFKQGEIYDEEVVEIFKSGFEGNIRLQEEEVIDGKWVDKKELLKEMDEKPKKIYPMDSRRQKICGITLNAFSLYCFFSKNGIAKLNQTSNFSGCFFDSAIAFATGIKIRLPSISSGFGFIGPP